MPPKSDSAKSIVSIPIPEDGNPNETFNPRQSLLATMSVGAAGEMDTPPPSSASLGVKWYVSHSTDQDSIRPANNNPGYRLERVVGVGGMGEVWEATQESLGRKVAIKKIKTPASGGSAAKSMTAMLSRSFQHEALITACLDHPNIVPVYDIGRDDKNEPLLAMKLVRGMSWDELLKADRVLSYHEQLVKHLPILIDVAHAVAFAHSRGVLHRDIKPSQVMVGEFGEVLLLDWGVACYFTSGDHRETEGLFAADSHGPVPLMQAMSPAGTPCFMAPEQTLETPEGLGPWTDIFLLGATLYFIISGKAPYGHAANSKAAAVLAADCRWPPLETLSTEERRIPPELIRVCARAMAKNPWERHNSVNDFIEEVQAFLNGSGRRRESMELTNKALEILNRGESGYGRLNECARLLVTARTIWSENPQVDEMEQLLHGKYAEAALSNGDLTLAREEAELLPDGKRRQQLMKVISRRQAIRERLPTERLIYGIASMLLLVFSISCLLIAVDLHRKANGRASAPKVALAAPTR